MVIERKAKIGLKDVGKGNKIKNESILEILENAGGEHSNQLGYGLLDIKDTGVSWILLEWKVKVIERPLYSEELLVKTWGRYFKKAYTYRDFEIYNSKGELCIIATSKWALMDTEKRTIVRISEEIKDVYQPEEKRVFEEETVEKIEIPTEYTNEIKYKVGRKDIDLNNHMHNTYYLNLAYEALPEEVYNARPYNQCRITYKKEIQLGDTVTCKYAHVDDSYIVVITNEEKDTINALIKLG